MPLKSNERIAGIILAVAASSAFIASAPVQADNRFPPVHTSATFNESNARSEIPVSGPWYLESVTKRIDPLTTQSEAIEVAETSSRSEPWYRAAN